MNKILIADDNQQITSILANYARKEGFEPLVALDGQQALELFEQHEKNIDVVLLDVMMPKLDGFEVCRELRRRSMVPIIMVTARGEDFERIMGLDIGADDYILKPFSAGESWRVSALSAPGPAARSRAAESVQRRQSCDRSGQISGHDRRRGRNADEKGSRAAVDFG
mgnify:CR=1 FL=1